MATICKINHDVIFLEISAFDRTEPCCSCGGCLAYAQPQSLANQDSGFEILPVKSKWETLKRLNFTCCCWEFHNAGTTPDVEGNTGGILRILTLGRAQEPRVHDLATAERETVHHSQPRQTPYSLRVPPSPLCLDF